MCESVRRASDDVLARVFGTLVFESPLARTSAIDQRARGRTVEIVHGAARWTREARGLLLGVALRCGGRFVRVRVVLRRHGRNRGGRERSRYRGRS